MTTPGPDEIFSCPHCKTILKRWTIGSGNTFGSTLWSDAKLVAPMLPQAVRVTRCPSCRKTFFVEDAEQLGTDWRYRAFGSEREPVPKEWEEASMVEGADADDLQDAIGQTTDSDRLRFLRMELWHKHNNPLREEPRKRSRSSPAGFVENLEALALLMDEGDVQDRLVKAEIWRELGRFDEAVNLLQDVPKDFAWVADQIRSLAASRTCDLAKLNRPDDD
jgi:hypothetical protein